ncbi:hypothetical protein RCO27_01550 [Sphingosinicella sp. LHD-64]|uniref:hypothetical protein n=1 Tax=Sphingosinicella sp. LHD-64 TaxID=3072139 RepID=UPI00280D02F1|nr:hypothetical protein [Sphingosinicella sp. LHD-64]MDQ8754901.1 hypothetical protein [Sphingosinicella sp. LHD-64]
MSKDSSSFSIRPALLGGAMALAMLSACNNAPTAGNAVLMSNSAAGADKAGAAPAAQTAASDLDPVLANPQVGDLYAAELTAFSGANFGSARPADATGNGGNGEKAYGLLRVVDVAADRVTVITETSAYENSRGAVNDLRGDLANITWDEQERIPINRADFARLVAEDKIIETRRMEGGGAGGSK